MFAVALVGTLGGCGPSASFRADDGLVRVSDSEIRSLDPQKVSDLASLRVASDQFEGLTRYNGAGVVEPGLASSWSVSADGKRWLFQLAPARRFSDGTPITAATLVGSFNRLRDPATTAPTASLFDPIVAMRAIAADRLEVDLASPFPTLPDLLAHPAVAALPLHRIAARGEDWVQDRPLVTSGPYRTAQWTLNERLTLSANPRWPAAARLVPQVQWQPVDDSLTALRQFRGGGADTVSDFPAPRFDGLKLTLGSAVHSAPSLGTYYLAFNTRQPPFADARVRQALSIAVDRDWLAGKIVGAGAQPACGVVPPQLLAKASPPPCPPGTLAARRAQAAQLLASAGYGPEKPLRFELRFNSAAEHRRIAIALAAMWQPLGVEVALFNSEASLHFAALKRADFALARAGWIADIAAPENFLAVHRSTGGAINYSGFADRHYDRLLEAAMAAGDGDQRQAVMGAANAYLADRAPVLPLYHYASRALVAARVRGWQDNAANIHPSATLTIGAQR